LNTETIDTTVNAGQLNTPMQTWLGIDVGTGLIGVAVGTTLTQSARPLASIPADPVDKCWALFDKLDAEWRPDGYVVGLPLMLDGSEQSITNRARAFAVELEERMQRKVLLIDERSTTKLAKRLFAEKRALGQTKRKHADAVDAWAAAIILERYLVNAA
jgi:putative holliday junction resolvase